MRLRKPLAVMAAGALAASLAACGSGGGGATGPGGKYQQGGAAGSGKDPSATGPALPVSGAVKGGTVTVLLPSPDTGPSNLDPTAGWSVTGNSIQQDLVSRSLTTYRYDTKTGQMVLVPDMATSLGVPNKNFTKWTFTIKPGLKYSNGQPITAKDFAWAIERSFDGNNGTSGAGIAGAGTQYSAEYFLDGTKYNGPYDNSTKSMKYKGVAANGNKLTILMSKSFPDMDYWGSFMAMGPIPPGKVSQPPKYGLKPLATGPYEVKSFNPGKELILVRNPQWNPATDPARHNYPNEWDFKFGQNPSATDALMLSNNSASQSSIATNVVATDYAKAKSQLGARLVQGSSPCTAFWYPDYKKINNLKIRQALGFAYPYADVWSAAGEVVGVTRVPGNTIEPPGMAGRKIYGPVGNQQVTYDPAKAKQLLKQAGVKPNTYKITWAYGTASPQETNAMKQLSAGLKAAGFVPNPLPYNDASSSLYNVWTADPKAATTEGRLKAKINMDSVAWCSDWPSGLTFIPPLFQTGQTYNTGGFSEPSVDAKMKAVTTLPLAKQPAAWASIDKLIETKYYPAINTGYINNLFAYGTKIGGFHNDSEIGAPDYRDIYVK